MQTMYFLITHFFEKKFSTLNFEGFFLKGDQGLIPKYDIRSEVSYFYAL